MLKGSNANYWVCSSAVAGQWSVGTSKQYGTMDNTTPMSTHYLGIDTINEISQGKLSSDISTAYPNKAYQGDYYYKYLGSDSIDPRSITYPTSAKAGERLNIKATASNSNTFGGTITYLYEYKKDGGAWDTTWYSSTSTSVAMTALPPSGTYQFRVRAKDNFGFTSTTYATGLVGQIIQNYGITVSASPTNGGTVSGGGEYSEGTSVTVTAAPANGWQFVSWQENGKAVSISAAYTFTVTGNRNLTAVFKQKLTAWIGVNGKARKGVELYVGVNGKARKVTAAYIGVNGKARRFL